MGRCSVCSGRRLVCTGCCGKLSTHKREWGANAEDTWYGNAEEFQYCTTCSGLGKNSFKSNSIEEPESEEVISLCLFYELQDLWRRTTTERKIDNRTSLSCL